MGIALNLPARGAAPEPEVAIVTSADRQKMEEICVLDAVSWQDQADRFRIITWGLSVVAAASGLYSGAYAVWLEVAWSGPRPHPLAPVAAIIGLVLAAFAVATGQQARVCRRNRLIALSHVELRNAKRS
jgi:hypothetical protein